MGFFTPDTTFYSEYADRGKYLLTWRLSVLFILVFGLLSAIFAFISFVAFALYFIVLLVGLAGFIYLNRTKHYIAIFWTYTISATILVCISLQIVEETIHYAEFFWIISIIIFAFIGLDRKVGILFLCINALSIIAHMVFSVNANIRADRPLTPVEIGGSLLEMLFALFTIGYLLHQYLLFQSYAEQQLQIANDELAGQNQVIVKKNEENSMLAKEIHHRVKNNLQIIISLLRMHSEEVKSEETKRHFSEAMNRIMTMSLIHQKLYQEKELSNIDFDSYLEELAQEIVASSRNEQRVVTYTIDSGIRRVGLKTIVPLGLLLNELMTNSLKHAFGGEGEGSFSIRVRETGNCRIVLEYSDTGTWHGSSGGPEGFGLELIDLLTHQLEGTVDREGSAYRFELGNLDH